MSVLAVAAAGCRGGGGGGAGFLPSTGGGSAGENSIAYAVSYSAPAETCPNGGITVYAGIDTNSNGVLDPEEYTCSPQYVCNGTDGVSIAVSLVSLPTGSMGCTNGGRTCASGLT